MSKVGSLGYLRLGVSSLQAWDEFAGGVLGFENAGVNSAGETMLRIDAHRARFYLHEDPVDDVTGIGWEARNPIDFAALVSKLRDAGVKVEQGRAADIEARNVLDLAKFTDPHGVACELYYGPTQLFEQPFKSPIGVASFVTGPLGLGHVVLQTDDVKKSVGFYTELLGFELSDYIHIGMLQSTLPFLHCNARHHTLAFGPFPAPKRLLHFMVQVESMDDVMKTFYSGRKRGVPIASDVGKHTNDHMVSCYFTSPSGFEVEYGFGAREIHEGWEVQRHDAPSIWGHHRNFPPQA
ncbi:MAG: VOC family protein [Hyphomonadaceae bacterium]|nr:VOC family protein [Hyphomonadaceae bacterium]